jgi:fructan beta-fructosidase
MPVREIEKLHAKKHQLKDRAIEPGKNPLAGIEAELMDISAAIDCGKAAEVGLVVRGTPVTYDVAKQMIACSGKTAPLKCPGGKLNLRVLVDRNSIEIFANDGVVYMPIGKIHPADNRSLNAYAKDGAAKATELTVWELRSAWE